MHGVNKGKFTVARRTPVELSRRKKSIKSVANKKHCNQGRPDRGV